MLERAEWAIRRLKVGCGHAQKKTNNTIWYFIAIKHRALQLTAMVQVNHHAHGSHFSLG